MKYFSKASMQFAQWDITGVCNLKCKHCRAWKLTQKKELTTKEGFDLLDQLYKLKVQNLNFSGGEPFLRRDIFSLLDHAQKFFSLVVTTNGTVLKKNEILQLRTFKNLKLSVSLDGLEKAHDEFRQVSGAFIKTIKTIALLTNASIPTSVKFTLTADNYGEASKVFKFISRYKIESFNIRSVIPCGRAENSLTISSERYKMIVEELLKISEKTKIPVVSSDPILLPLYPELLGNIWQEMGQRIYSEICAGCLAGDEVLYIGPNGDVGACAYIPIVAGNIRETSLRKLINHSSLFRNLNNWRVKLKGRCRTCQYKDLCGGCRAVALIENSDILAEDPRCLF